MKRTDRGFTMTELIVVVAIVAIMAAVAVPNLLAYLKAYRIRGATQLIASELSTARLKAIMKNVNHGVIFVVLPPGAPGNNTTRIGYKWALEDMTVGFGTRPTTTDAVSAAPPLSGQFRMLPDDLRFSTGCPIGANYGVGFTSTPAVNDAGMRFNRMGGWCDPDSSSSWSQAYCPALSYTNSQNVIANTPQGSFICLEQITTGLKRWVWVTTGGRVLVQP